MVKGVAAPARTVLPELPTASFLRLGTEGAGAGAEQGVELLLSRLVAARGRFATLAQGVAGISFLALAKVCSWGDGKEGAEAQSRSELDKTGLSENSTPRYLNGSREAGGFVPRPSFFCAPSTFSSTYKYSYGRITP